VEERGGLGASMLGKLCEWGVFMALEGESLEGDRGRGGDAGRSDSDSITGAGAGGKGDVMGDGCAEEGDEELDAGVPPVLPFFLFFFFFFFFSEDFGVEDSLVDSSMSVEGGDLESHDVSCCIRGSRS